MENQLSKINITLPDDTKISQISEDIEKMQNGNQLKHKMCEKMTWRFMSSNIVHDVKTKWNFDVHNSKFKRFNDFLTLICCLVRT